MKSSSSQSLDRLLGRARQGDRSALERVMRSCRPWLLQRARTRLPRELARKQDASDMVQEVQYRAAIKIGHFQGRSLGEFRAWLAGILDRRVFQALRFWKEKRRDRTREEPLSPSWSARGGALAAGATSVLERLAQEEECERVELAKSWCREEDRAVIVMHLNEGRSHDEIAAELGITTTAARQRFSRALRRVGEATQLLEWMTQRGWSSLQQDVIGLHRFQGAKPGEIAERLQLPAELVARWIAEAQPLVRTLSEGSDS
jgi:RNA polymerase sigma-70 factor (ECF subfamily)